NMSRRITAYLQGEEAQTPVRRIAGTSATSRRKLGRGLTSIDTPTQDTPPHGDQRTAAAS
ncbi:MAG: hypothetical protein Q4C47_04570, partial [Planctomycetia bacterium]|nr:hypothetical protein [Planctomycetia bacterium]